MSGSRRMDLDDAERAILEARTRAAARPAERLGRAAGFSGAEDAVDAGGAVEAVVLGLGEERYAIPAADVRAVAEIQRLTPLPHAPPAVAGLALLGGGVVPVFHLRPLLGLPLASLPERGRVVLLGEGDGALALAVDAVLGIVQVRPGALGEPPSSLGPARPFARGIDASGLTLLDAEALLASGLLVVDIPLPRSGGDEEKTPE